MSDGATRRLFAAMNEGDAKRSSERHARVLDEAFALFRPVARNILNKTPIAHDVEDLKAAANPEDREVALDRGLRDLDLEFVAVTLYVGARDVHRPVSR